LLILLQGDTGRFNGRWSYGHHLWIDYKQIAQELSDRTKVIQKNRGLTVEGTTTKAVTRESTNFKNQFTRINFDDDQLNGDEPDTLDVRYIEKNMGGKVRKHLGQFASPLDLIFRFRSR
jgi:hypothetical protein